MISIFSLFRQWFPRRVVWLTSLAIFAIGMSVAGLLWCLGDAAPELRTVDIKHGDLRIVIPTTGTVEPKQVVQVSPQVNGRLVSFGSDPTNPDKRLGVGTKVSKGTILFQIERQDYEEAAQLARTNFRLVQKELGRQYTYLEQASRNLRRADQLRATNSQHQYEDAVTAHTVATDALEILRTRLQQASDNLVQAENRLQRTTVRSPIDGVVIDCRAILGQHVHAGQAGLFLLATDLKRMRIRASVSESDIGKIEVGQEVAFTVDAYRDRTLTGRVEKLLLNARVQGTFVTYDVLVAIDETDAMLFPHMTASVEFEIVKRENAWQVPNAALQWKPEPYRIAPGFEEVLANAQDARIWMPTGDGLVRPVGVNPGIEDGVMTEVLGARFRDDATVVVGLIQKTRLARIIPSAKTVR